MQPENKTILLFASKSLLRTYKLVGFTKTIVLFSVVAFFSVTLIIIPINMLMGGSILTGMVINVIVCTTFMPYHLYQVLSLLVELDTLRMEIYDTSIRDELTKAYNRRYFFEATRILENTDSHIPPHTSILLIDLDDFKVLNDTYGHATGDRALKTLTEQCNLMFRNSDVFARYGGDEFICLLPQTNHEQAHEIAKRTSERFSEVTIKAKGAEIPLHASIGVATSSTEQKLSDLISMADQALYKAKRQGKNRIQAL
ncbi:MAG: GGDEF domain-containing protein [Anaerolineales bacterium]|uniref:GGDEF domain-containing protein n=1 Tax=Candidatus Villigracilis vicinus TaxID=3140679 RepID=UPI003135BDAD|nr:GGDEF domain-containing protein [Anaerolineales bacterium]